MAKPSWTDSIGHIGYYPFKNTIHIFRIQLLYELYVVILLYVQEVVTHFLYILKYSYYINWVTTSWTYSISKNCCCAILRTLTLSYLTFCLFTCSSNHLYLFTFLHLSIASQLWAGCTALSQFDTDPDPRIHFVEKRIRIRPKVEKIPTFLLLLFF